MATTYRCCDLDELTDEEHGEWIGLHRSSGANPQLGPGFAGAVVQARGGVRVVVARDGRGPVTGVWPFQRRRWRMAEPVGFPLADFHGPLRAPGSEFDVAAALRAAGVDTYDYDHLVDTGPFTPWTVRTWTSPAIDLAGGLDPAGRYFEELAGGGSNLPGKLAYYRRRLEREHGAVQVEAASADHAVLDHLIAGKRDQYGRTGRHDPLEPAWRRDLLHRLLDQDSGECQGVLSVLRAGETVLASHFGLRSTSVLHYWFPAYDVRFARSSPGLVLLAGLVEAAGSWGIRRVDLGTGEAEYKRRFATSAVTLAAGRVERPSVLVATVRLKRAIARPG